MKVEVLVFLKRVILLGVLLVFPLKGVLYAQVSTDTNASFSSIPINLSGNDVTPLVMLNVSRDHQLSYKAYTDYSDLNNDGVPEKTYDDQIEYYGYFDSSKCYSYDTNNNRFSPTENDAVGTNSHYCTSEWSGNFLNWATMTRMDVVRKLLYGGQRSEDSTTLTVLERQYLPTDAHSFAKFYNGNDISSLTPFNVSSTDGITIANLTKGSSSGDNRYSDSNTNPPLMRVAKGDFALWGANERWQCYWFEEKSAPVNGNIPAVSGLDSSINNPSQTTDGLGKGVDVGEYIVRVEVAVDGKLGAEKYKKYGSSYKPVGLLQIYGDADQISFGLMTGSFQNNVSGGVLRKNAASFKDEINTSDGTFKTATDGIVKNLNRIRIYGYDYKDGTYIGRDDCTFQQTGFVRDGSGSVVQGQAANEGNCASWGNPMSELYLESLRYLAGKAANSDFTYGTGSNDAALGLTVATWADPIDSTNYCAPLNVLNFNASVSSNDGDQMGGVSDLGTTLSAKQLTDAVGVNEGINAASWFVGSNGVSSNDLCSSKDIGSGFGAYAGLCPEAPTQEGTYLMSGVAHYANTNRIRTDLTVPTSRADSRDLMVTTYGIALATNVPKIEVTSGDKTVTILPAYRLDVSSKEKGPYGGGTLVDFKIIEQDATHGKFYVNWEDSEMGGDYDSDMWGLITYTVSGDEITVTTDAIAQATGNGQGFGYVISGTDKDGAHFHSGIYNFDFTDPTGVIGCTNCVVGDAATSAKYTMTGSSAGVLEDPLWYAAKYGGFTDDDSSTNNLPDSSPNTEEWDSTDNYDGTDGADGLPDNYFYATNPLQLENSLNLVFLTILQRASSGTAAAVVSNNVSGTGALYQAYYEPLRQDVNNNEVTWIGTVQSLWLDDYGYLREDDGDATLEGYLTDPVIQQFYDETENKTKIRRYVSTSDDAFLPYYMKGRVTAYDATNYTVTFSVLEIGGAVGSGPFSSWTISNLTTDDTDTSNTSSTIVGVSTPATTKTFTVSATGPSYTVGNIIMVSYYETTEADLEDLGTIWNAREQLNFEIADAEDQRAFSSPATDSINGGRFVKTWLDDGDGVVEAGEFVDFANTTIDSSNFGFLNVADETEAKNVVDYIRGKEITGYRSRTLDYDGTGEKVMRLSDVVNATPTVVGAPDESLDLIYKDTTYGVFKKKYKNRRQVLYVGSNGGMLHAFNGGFYDSSTKSFLTKLSGTTSVEHPLGAEIWSYVPMNLLPHLKWLTDDDYSHVYYVDGKPSSFDAKIFTADTDHPGGWGTVLVVGMKFGGGNITVDTAGDGLTADPTPEDNREFSSAFIFFDITNPEEEPILLAEIQVPDGSFSTSYPAAFTVKNKDTTLDENKWFLSFGSGPTSLDGTSTVNAKIYVMDLEEIANPGRTTTVPTGCTIETIAAGTVPVGDRMKILSCDTGVTTSFVGDPIAVDWELDYKADQLYFGVVGDENATSGRVMRFSLNGEADPKDWDFPTTLMNTDQPVVSAVTPGIDETDQKWIYFGTGRLFVSADQLSTSTQTIYGVKDDGSTVAKTDLLDVSDADVTSTGDLTGVTGLSTFTDLEDDIELNRDGWYRDLPPIQGTAGSAPSTRVINPSALAGGVLFTSAYQPGIDLCTGEGYSRLYGLYYKTGTAYPDPIIGTYTVSAVEYSAPYVELGNGFAAAPSLHTGTGSGDNTVNVFTQLSTGAIIQTTATTVTNIRSGLVSWSEPK
jgi:type IV pilus assembly protein PilY1